MPGQDRARVGPTTGALPPGTVPIDQCQLCGSSTRALVFADPPFQVLRCCDCGLVYLTPRLFGSALEQIYDEGYWKSAN
ncbi:MAG TPA: hypothetical protein VK348_04200, partial [Planctomycetota bacterium]|nr:hypothetical protein [Planctomycetota bacterium]